MKRSDSGDGRLRLRLNLRHYFGFEMDARKISTFDPLVRSREINFTKSCQSWRLANEISKLGSFRAKHFLLLLLPFASQLPTFSAICVTFP
jgi:hypothetical protein